VVIALLAGVCLCHALILRAVARFLIVDEQLPTPDAVWIRTENGLIGDGDRCYDQAARLYREDASRRIILSEPYPIRLVQIGIAPCFQVISRRELGARGVPKDAVAPIDGAWSNPAQEVRRLGGWLREHPHADVLLLCDRFRSRRMRCILNTVLGRDHARAVKILALPDRRYDETNWWRSRCGVKSLFYGYVALTYAWCQGGDAPEPERWDPDDYERVLEQAVGEAS